MALGCAIPLGIWTDQHWLTQVFLSFMLMGNFFMAYKLRDMQNIGTSWVFVLVYALQLTVWVMLNIIGAALTSCSRHTVQAWGFSGCLISQLVTVVMLFTMR